MVPHSEHDILFLVRARRGCLVWGVSFVRGVLDLLSSLVFPFSLTLLCSFFCQHKIDDTPIVYPYHCCQQRAGNAYKKLMRAWIFLFSLISSLGSHETTAFAPIGTFRKPATKTRDHPAVQTAIEMATVSESEGAVKDCAKMVAVSALVDSVTTVKDFFYVANHSYASLFGLLAMLWKVGFSRSLYTSTEIYLQRDKKDESKDLEKIFRTMARTWRAAAWIIVFGATVDFAGLWGHDPPSWLRPGAVITALIGAVTIRWLNYRQVQQAFVLDSELSHSQTALRNSGMLAVRNMALCIGALFLNAAMTASLAVYHPVSLYSTVSGLLGARTQFLVAMLLYTLRRALLDFVVVRTTEGQTKGSIDDSTLYSAQKEFYSKVGSNFKSEVQGKTAVSVFQVGKSLVSFLREGTAM